MAAIAGIDYVNMWRDVACDQMRCTGLRMAYYEHIRTHGREIIDGIEQGLTFGLRRGADIQIHGIGGEAFGCDLEGGAGPCRGLEKQIEDRLAAQQGDFFHFALTDRNKRFGGVENGMDQLGGQAFDGE